jgi:hypothetical protein
MLPMVVWAVFNDTMGVATLATRRASARLQLFYWPPKPKTGCTRVTGGGFHLPVSASGFGA